MKPPFILCSTETSEIWIYDSIDQLTRDVESVDVENGMYAAFDSEGKRLLLEIIEPPDGRPEKTILGLRFVAQKDVAVRAAENEPTHDAELRRRLLAALESVDPLDRQAAEALSLANLVEKAASTFRQPE